MSANNNTASISAPPRLRAKRPCKSNKEWLKTFEFIQESSLGQHFALRTYCKNDISITGGGINDITRHSTGKKHREYANAVKSSHRMADYIAVGDSEIEKIRRCSIQLLTISM